MTGPNGSPKSAAYSEGEIIGAALSGAFAVLGNVTAARQVGIMFAKLHGYTDLVAGLEFVEGFISPYAQAQNQAQPQARYAAQPDLTTFRAPAPSTGQPSGQPSGQGQPQQPPASQQQPLPRPY